jgi:hypothetical protein
MKMSCKRCREPFTVTIHTCVAWPLVVPARRSHHAIERRRENLLKRVV